VHPFEAGPAAGAPSGGRGLARDAKKVPAEAPITSAATASTFRTFHARGGGASVEGAVRVLDGPRPALT
jgi:hypothetical protein